jgi:hypothetical protein
VRGEHIRPLAAELLAQELVIGLDFAEDGVLHLDTRDLPQLLARLQEAGLAGQIHSMEIDDQKLEMVYDLLVGGSAR